MREDKSELYLFDLTRRLLQILIYHTVEIWCITSKLKKAFKMTYSIKWGPKEVYCKFTGEETGKELYDL